MFSALQILVAIYLIIASILTAHIYIAQKIFRKALVEDRNGTAVSLAWAWIRRQKLLAAERYWGSDRFGNINDYPAPHIMRLYLPHKIIVVCAVLIYQYFIRYGSAFGPGDCPSTPNCSNYFVGCLTRYSLIISMAKAHVRVKACTGVIGPNFTENFL